MDDMEQAERLANTYADAILRLSYTYLKNTHDAQDICQTVFVKLLMEPPGALRAPEHERAYILRMAANACKDLLKSPWRQRSQSLDVGLEVPAPQAGDGSVLEAVKSAAAPTTGPSFTCSITRVTRLPRSVKSWASPPQPSTPGWPGDGRS